MFNIAKSIKKIIGFHKDDVESVQSEVKNNVVGEKLDKLSGGIRYLIAYIVVEYRIIKQKMRDLSGANYDLGIKYLEEGNIKEAIFRFKIIMKFWPHNYEAHYQLVYCLILKGDTATANKVAAELLEKDPSYKEKIDYLLSHSSDIRNINISAENSEDQPEVKS